MSTETLVRKTGSAVIDRGVMSGADIKARLDLIVDIADHAMKPNIDYGKVPGTDKPSLWQAGADKLCVAFQIAPKIKTVEELGLSDEKTYRVTIVGVHQPSGIELAEGIGECSSNEEKYRWRFCVHENEWNATDTDTRRVKYKRDGSEIRQIRTSPADVANTVLKMAVKRGKIAMVLAATGAAAIFTQDVEDLAEELREQLAEDGSKPETKQPQRKSASGGAAPATKPVPEHAKTAVGVIDKLYADKKPWAVLLKGSPAKYTGFDDALLADVKQFAGTTHRVKLAYTETVKGDKTYLNVVGVGIADEPATAATTPAAAPLKDTDIFGGAGREREPGEDD